MKHFISKVIKNIVLTIIPDSNRLRFLAYRPMLETWRKLHKDNHPEFTDRKDMYDYINNVIIGNKSIQYLEFGVFKGHSIKHFARINSDPDSTFTGFDTFTGLPEDWIEFSRTVKSQTFDTGGEIPQTDDKRISFLKGMFQDTLPDYLKEYKAGNLLVIHNDSDLYSSTLYVLTYLNDIIVPGTIIIFDEFYSVMHEYRALEDYCSSYMRKYEVIASTNNHEQIAIKLLD